MSKELSLKFHMKKSDFEPCQWFKALRKRLIKIAVNSLSIHDDVHYFWGHHEHHERRIIMKKSLRELFVDAEIQAT